MADINENINKAKNMMQDSIKKVQENESVSQAVEKLNQNEYVGKAKSMAGEAVKTAKKNKNYKYIKIGALLLIIVLLFQYCANGERRKAEKFAEWEIVQPYKESDYRKIKSTTKYIGKGSNFYIIDVTVSGLDFGRQRFSEGEVCIVYPTKKGFKMGATQDYYTKDGQKDAREYMKEYGKVILDEK